MRPFQANEYEGKTSFNFWTFFFFFQSQKEVYSQPKTHIITDNQ